MIKDWGKTCIDDFFSEGAFGRGRCSFARVRAGFRENGSGGLSKVLIAWLHLLRVWA
jgi:hypothetical protein